MTKLTINQAAAILKARTRMIPCNQNFRVRNNNGCTHCRTDAEETQNHILKECTSIHQDNSNKVSEEDIFSEDIEILKDTANKINATLKKIK